MIKSELEKQLKILADANIRYAEKLEVLRDDNFALDVTIERLEAKNENLTDGLIKLIKLFT